PVVATKARRHEGSFGLGFVTSCLRGSFVMLLGVCTLAAPETTFKAGARTVAVYATVTSPTGRLVPDLPREAFTIYDNGKPQPLTLFANEVQPITVVLLLDRSVSMVRNFELVEKAAE